MAAVPLGSTDTCRGQGQQAIKPVSVDLQCDLRLGWCIALTFSATCALGQCISLGRLLLEG